VREEELSLGGVGELERAEDEARGFEFGGHGSMVPTKPSERPTSRERDVGSLRLVAERSNYVWSRQSGPTSDSIV
jgi:hypothetical protein